MGFLSILVLLILIFFPFIYKMLGTSLMDRVDNFIVKLEPVVAVSIAYGFPYVLHELI